MQKLYKMTIYNILAMIYDIIIHETDNILNQ